MLAFTNPTFISSHNIDVYLVVDGGILGQCAAKIGEHVHRIQSLVFDCDVTQRLNARFPVSDLLQALKTEPLIDSGSLQGISEANFCIRGSPQMDVECAKGRHKQNIQPRCAKTS